MKAPYSRTFFDLLLEQSERHAQLPCYVSSTEHYSYAALYERAALVAARLQTLGMRRGDRIGLLAQNQIEWLEIFFGAAALGATVVPFSTWSTTRELEFLVQDSQISVLFMIDSISERSFVQALEHIYAANAGASLKHVYVINADGMADGKDTNSLWPSYAKFLDIEAAFDDLPPGVGPSATDTAVVLYTSGSSAKPKSVPLTHAHALENAFNIGERLGLTSSDRVLVPVPLFWSYGAINALPAIFSHGACLVTQRQFRPQEALALIEEHQCTALYTLPAITNALLGASEFSPARTQSLRTGVTIGTPQDLRRAATELGAAQICNIYGSTETYGNCAVTWHHWPLEQRALCQGPALPGVELRSVAPETGEVCAPDVVGDLEVRGYLTPGYGGASAVYNAVTFRDDGFFRTGDLASINAQGHVTYAGRSSEMIKRSGINVAPAEIEEVLQELPLVGLVGVTGIADAHLGEAIVAFVLRRSDAAVSDAQLQTLCRAHCAERLSKYKLPDQILMCDALPLTPTGKLLRKGLKQLLPSDNNTQND